MLNCDRNADRLLRLQHVDLRAQREELEAADGVDAAEEVALVDRHALRRAREVTRPPSRLSAEDERSPDRVVEAREAGDARVDRLRGDQRIGDLDRERVEHAVLGEHAIVARVVVDRQADRRGEAGAEQVGDGARRHLRRRREAADHQAGLVLLHVDVLELVGAEDAHVVAEQIAPGQIAAARGAVERRDRRAASCRPRRRRSAWCRGSRDRGSAARTAGAATRSAPAAAASCRGRTGCSATPAPGR